MDVSSELAAARRRLTELEAVEAERAHAAKVQDALYRIAELASAAQDMQGFYQAIHGVVGELMPARNLFVALYDEERQRVSWPYFVDERAAEYDLPESSTWEAFGEGSARGLTAYVLRTNAPQLVDYGRYLELIERGEIEVIGATSEEQTWLGVPLKAEGLTIGVLVVQSYTKDLQYTEQDLDLLAFVGQHVGAALSRARAIEETRQRNAELALINSVQEAIAGEFDQQAIYDAVGDRIQEIFDAQAVMIIMLDETTGQAVVPYSIERGERQQWEPMTPGGFSGYVLETRESLMINEDVAGERARRGLDVRIVGEPPKSVLFVPLLPGGKATGTISLQNVDREHAFSASDQQLLETLAGSLSVALENARLVHETRQRNAELALINSVQEAIAGELDPQAIYDAVGDRIQEIFDAQTVGISILDEVTGLMHYPYIIERGERLQAEPLLPAGFSKHVLETREPLLLVENLEAESERYGSVTLAGEPPKSVLFVPLVTGGNATGTISLQNIDREHAFGESDRQLLTTLAGSLSVALDNARLVHETRQRNAELALINSVQEAIAGELDPQAIYDVVGDKIRDVFDAQTVIIATLDEATGLQHFPYIIERGERLQQDPIPLSGFTKHVLETREPLMINEDAANAGERYGSAVVGGGERSKSVLFVPLVTGGRATGVVSLQNVDRERAFGESDQQLLETLAGSLSVALENARLVHETKQRNAELALINSVQEAIAGELDPQAIYDVVGDKIRDVFDAQTVTISTLDEATTLLHYPYFIESGERFAVDPRPMGGFAKHVLETREPLLLAENLEAESERYGSVTLAGEPPKSVLFVPLVTGGRATGVVSLQNVDREHAFSEADERLLVTLSGSLSVALENARLVDETRQRVAELATVNSVGQALSSQLDLDALIELVGERVRETFEADIAYVALHDEAAGQIDFVYYYEPGEDNPEPLAYGEGLTSQILDSREPLLLNRQEHYEGLAHVGTPSRSYLGVPILVGEKAIGVISVQSTREEGRFGDDDTRLLATIAANVGVAIQKARLFGEIGRQKQYFESLVEVSPAAVVVMDADERVTGWNPAATELFGYSSEEATGRAIDDLVLTEELRREGRDVTSEALEKGRAHRITRRARKDGALVDVEMMLVPLGVAGEHVGFYGIYHDITELQRAREEAEAATQAKSAFLATMSHEIRTPMNAVIGMTGLLLGTDLTPEQREFAEVVRSSGDALLHVIDDILDYSKIEAGKLELEKEPVDLRECVEGALEIAAPRAWEKEIELGCLIDENAPAGIVADAARLRQVLLNLLSNAVKFTEEGEVVVQVDAEPTGARSYRLAFAVRDTGIGIAEERMDRLFTSFSQVDASTTRRYGGSGLGLAISKRLVELMGGTMWAESEKGTGSTFRFSLPVKAAQVPARAETKDQPQLGEKRLLIVDDNATNREIVTRHARSWGMEPIAIASPTEALARIEGGEQFDVAVLDMMMPELDGLALAREIRQHRDERQLPLVLLTSLGRLPQAQSASEFAVQLSKPVRASQLYNALVKALAEHVPEPSTGERVADESKPATSRLRILLAEDNAVNQQVALKLLEQLGYRADVAANGLEALDALERERYDVVLMDVQMPELDGLEASRRICARWPAEDRPRIIAMTANAMPEDRAACFAAGMDDYLAKPIRPNELVKALRGVRPHEDTRTSSEEAPDDVLDHSALATLRELGGDAFLAEVIETFLNDAPVLLAALRTSSEHGDTEELRRTAHTLKSNGQTFGAGRFSELCRELEERARSGALNGSAELVVRIEREYRALEEILVAVRSTAAA